MSHSRVVADRPPGGRLRSDITRWLDRVPRLKAVLKKVWSYYRRRAEGEAIILARYERIHGHPLNLMTPSRFTEKLNCRMVAMHRREQPLFTRLTDKYAVRSFVAGCIGETYLTRLYWHGTHASRIPFDRLPERFVVKSNHASGQIIQVDGAVDRESIIATAHEWLEVNYYWHAREYQYLGIRPRILVEEFLDDGAVDGPLDYRFWCFEGVPAVIQIGNHRHVINPFFDLEWNRLDLIYRPGSLDVAIPKPPGLELMITLASRLSAGIDFVRVDLYNLQGRICFGEMTFTPVSGQLTFHPERWDLELGQKWVLRDLPA